MFDAGVSRDLSNELIKVRKICSFHIHADGDTIHTENSYKFAVEDFRALALRAGFRPGPVWLDDERLFSVHWLYAPGHALRAPSRPGTTG